MLRREINCRARCTTSRSSSGRESEPGGWWWVMQRVRQRGMSTNDVRERTEAIGQVGDDVWEQQRKYVRMRGGKATRAKMAGSCRGRVNAERELGWKRRPRRMHGRWVGWVLPKGDAPARRW
jgi:hypothetical protein